MERLDLEESSARAVRTTEGIPAERAVRYLQGLGEAWRIADGGLVELSLHARYSPGSTPRAFRRCGST
jgi:hypothetical protein